MYHIIKTESDLLTRISTYSAWDSIEKKRTKKIDFREISRSCKDRRRGEKHRERIESDRVSHHIYTHQNQIEGAIEKQITSRKALRQNFSIGDMTRRNACIYIWSSKYKFIHVFHHYWEEIEIRCHLQEEKKKIGSDRFKIRVL